MNDLVKYNALIINSDIDARMRLKSATTSVIQFSKVQLLTNLNEGLSRLEGGHVCDVLFVSYSFEKDEVKQFIKDAKGTKSGEDAAYILVLETGEQDSSVIAENVLIGADGFLFEPYSVDQLVEITNLAARVKRERAEEREQAALTFLLKDMMHQIDLIAYLKANGYDVGRGFKRFKQMCSVLNTLEGTSKELYMNLAVELFSEAPFPKNIYQKSYSGASKRVKEKMEKKLLAELEKDMEDDDTDEVQPEAST